MPMNNRLLRPRENFTPRSISGLALWLDAADSSTLYTTDAGNVTAVSAPTEISGCVGWWDASDASSITQSGGLVSQWNDKSGNGNHATASGTARPTHTAGGLNGLSVMTFDGTANSMAVAANAAFNSNDLTYFVVFRQAASANKGVYTKLNSAAGTNGFGLAVRANSPAVWPLQKNANLDQVLLFQVDPTTAARIYSVTSSSSAAGYLDGVQSATASSTADHSLSQTVRIGSSEGTEFLNGYIAEVIHFNRALTRVEVSRVEAYLAAKWGIAGVHAPATATNDPVGAWLDKSGNGRHATQASGARRASVSSSLTNNRRGVAFAATASTSQQLTTSLPVNDSELFTVFCVMREAATPTQGISNRVFLGNVNPGDFYYALNTAGSTSATTHVQLYAEGTYAWLPNPGTTPHIVAVTKTSASQMFLNYDGSFGHMTSNVNPQYATVATAANRGLARFVNSIGSSANGSQGFTGQILEILAYPIVLSTSERQRVERYLAAKWGITLAPQVSNADAQDWINRVYANGGTVSAATANAVNQFCVDIENAGIRDRFYRLNLFCGNSDANLAAVRTPLYRGPSLTGTQFGNATDTNINFVAGDYAENVGLTSGASSKHLRIGTLQSVFGGVPATGHMSARVGAWPGTLRRLLGIFDLDLPSGQTHVMKYGLSFASNGEAAFGRTPLITFTPLSQTATYLVNRSSSTLVQFYRDGSLQSSNTNQSDNRDIPTAEMTVFGQTFYRWSNNTFSLGYETPAPPMLYYSCGLSMTAAQVGALHTAMQAFQTALGRQV